MKTLVIISLIQLFGLTLHAQNWDWIQTINGGGNNYLWDITTDSQGNVITCGRVKFDVTFGLGGSSQTAPQLGIETDIYVAKWSPSGDLLWYRRNGNVNPDWARSVSVDLDDNIYVTGDFVEIAVFGSDTIYGYVNGQTTPNGMARSGFIAKYDPLGTLQWVRSFQSTGHTRGYAISVDDNANSYVTGYTTGICDFGNGVTTGDPVEDLAFIAKFDFNGNPVWANYVQSQYYSRGNDIKVIDDTTIIVTGGYCKQMTYNGQVYPGWSPTWSDHFALCIDSTGGPKWAKTGIGPHFNEGRDIALDVDNNIYIVGRFSNFMVIEGDTIYTVGTGMTSTEINDHGDAFVIKYDVNGNFLWFNHIGNEYSTDFTGITIYDESVLITGESIDTIFFTGYLDTLIPTADNHNTMLISYDLDGNYEWSKLVTSIAPAVPPDNVQVSGNKGLTITTDLNHNVFVGGYFNHTAHWDATTISSVANYDAFIAKLFPPLNTTVSYNSTDYCQTDTAYVSCSANGSPLSITWLSSSGNTILNFAMDSVGVSFSTNGLDTLSCVIDNGYETDTVFVYFAIDDSNCLGIGQVDQAKQVLIYPIPVSSSLTMDLSQTNKQASKFELIDIAGNVVIQGQLADSVTAISMSEEKNGLYVLRVYFEDGTVSIQKVVKL